jgi:phospholipase/carboxylesterase
MSEPLKYRIIPAKKPDSKHILIVLHGLGDSMLGYTWMPEALGIPTMNYALVNAPDPYFGGYSWYDFTNDPGPGVKRSRKALLELMDSLEEQGFPRDQTFLFGFSQGCLMTLDVGYRSPKPLAGLIGVSGYVYEPERLVQEMTKNGASRDILMTHGLMDTMVPIDRTRDQVHYLRSQGIKVEWEEFQKDHTIAGAKEVDAFRNYIQARMKTEAEPS